MSLHTLAQSIHSLKKGKLYVSHSGSASIARLAQLMLSMGNSVVIVVRDAKEMGEYKSLLQLLSPELSSTGTRLSTPLWEQPIVTLPEYPTSSLSKNGWAERISTLYSLQVQQGQKITLVTVENFLLRLPPVDIFLHHELRLSKNMDMAPELVLEQAIDWGYVRTPMVSIPGDIALRGDILDIFCPGYQRPFRLEFFGDILDDIRIFDAGSQRSIASLDEVCLLPVAPVITSKQLIQKAESFWDNLVDKKKITNTERVDLSRRISTGDPILHSGLFYEKASYLEDWLPKNPILVLPGEKKISASLENLDCAWRSSLIGSEESKENHHLTSLVLRPKQEVEELFSQLRTIYFEELVTSDLIEGQISLPERRIHSFQALFPQVEVQERPWHCLVAAMQQWSLVGSSSQYNEEKRVDFLALPENMQYGKLILSFANERSRARFLKLAEQDGIFPKQRYHSEENGLFALISPFRSGVFLSWDNTLILGEDVLQPKVDNAKRVVKSAFQGLDRYDSLKEGDFLVHRDYGICAFGGLHHMALGDVEKDFLLLKYAGEDKLYLPVDRLSLIQVFKANDGTQPIMDKLGGSLWTSSKEKARKAIEKIAADLVEMYALRKVVKGFNYSPISEMYREFEASFGFEETPDQAKAIEDVLNDMEKPEPMDRLICGDVGFGKTEVALRAAFRAALEGRQVAMLCPTTVLAEQHYQTFRSRLSGFPVNVGLLSRFVSKAKQKETLEATAKGQIDILIGTHRLLSKDIVLPNLGLLILDEEQRFGVRHKERLKEMRKNVDALTLTATPIPRTLQLSLSGIRDLSIIETPPPERKPISTALIERDDATLKGVLEREILRKGQVFWVYNRVQGLERVVEYVKKLVPDARIGMAHGQMNEKTLESAIHDFWHGEIDVLVCTSIVESGLDFPMANTLVVDQAHLFGLGQLYQLRGRVGRSNRQAFAIFITPDPNKLSDIARQRMRILLEMDYLGAGFQVAMEDLRLRGAGNILGESQSGHMNRLGLDLFLEMLEEAVAKLKGETVRKYNETELSLGVPALIPKEYIEDSKERLRYYKLLSSAQDDLVQQDIELEIKDRFGLFPLQLVNFAVILGFKRRLTKWGISKADILPEKVQLYFSDSTDIQPSTLVHFVTEKKEMGIKLLPPATLEIPMRTNDIKEGILKVESLVSQLFINIETEA